MEILFVGVFVRFFYGNSAPVAGLERFAGLALQFSAARVFVTVVDWYKNG